MGCVVDVLACACKVNKLRSLNQFFRAAGLGFFFQEILNCLYVVIGGVLDGFDPASILFVELLHPRLGYLTSIF